ncbi:MAG: hypothetical protein LLG02_03220 [Pelosinus sp.]|nr:hypothetical protein [Pelosinus sp.]
MMNKKLLTTAIVSMMVLSTGAVMAAPIQLDGSMSYRYRNDTNTTREDNNASIFRFTLNAKTEIAPNLSLYGRLAAESISKRGGFASDIIQGDNTAKSIAEVDQFGFIYTNSNFTYKLGKQDAVIGGTGLLYDSTGYLGKNNGLSGINITGTTGVTSVSVLAGQENAYGTVDNKVYAVRAAFSPVKDLTIGGTLAKYDADKDINYYAVDAAFTQGKATYSAEYAKSNADSQNKAYDIGVSYAFDSKNSVSVTNFKVQDNATIDQTNYGSITGYEDNGKGFYYSYNHKFTKDTSATLFYRDYKDVDGANKNHNTSFRATVNYNF